ncbi:MAG: hypothetical protein AB7I52_17730 [Rhizobiaceae bacterium]
MEFSTILPRRGRPPKALGVARPVQTALLEGPPADLVEQVARVEIAFKGFAAARKLRDDARSEYEEGSSAQSSRLNAAITARNRAYAQRDVAESLGEQSDAPTAETIAALEAAVDVAQAEFDRGQPAPRLAALSDEMERRRKLLEEAVNTANDLYRPWANAIAVAADAQIHDAVQCIAEAYAVTNQVRTGWPSVGQYVSLPKLTGEGRHSTPDTVDVAAATRSISSTIYAARLAAAPDTTRAADAPGDELESAAGGPLGAPPPRLNLRHAEH